MTGMDGTAVRPASWQAVVRSYVEVTKVRSVLLLVFTAAATMAVAAREVPVDRTTAVLALVAVTLACAGANAVSCYADRDLDAVMVRTRHRPIPAGRIHPPERALWWGGFLFLVSLVLAWRVNWPSVLALLAGGAGYVGVYSLWLKRRSPLNIVLGGFSGGLPAVFGWTAVTGTLTWLPVLIAALVVLWIPNHIWSLAIFYREDYLRVRVPMLPVVDERRALRCILSTVVLMVGVSLVLYFVGRFGYVYLSAAALLGTAALYLGWQVYARPAPSRAWRLFKFSSVYLFLVFLAMMGESLFA